MEYRKQQFLTYDEFTRQFACDYAMPLARGGHGEIYRGVDLETNEEVAIKRRLYSVDDNALTLEKEYANTQAVPVNRFVVRYLYYGRYATPFGTYEFLVMRYYRDGNLTSDALAWGALSTLQQQRFVSEFLLGLSHLHTHGIIHRDIKPENVLLVRYSDSEGIAFRPVIVDFGISKMMTDHPEAARAFVQNSMRIGTVTYMAPEQLHTENIDYNADLWSFGIILYELITSKHMIARKSFPETQREEAYAFWRMANEERFPDDLRTVPQPYQQMIRKCLIVSSEERVQSARDLLDLLELQPRIVAAEQAFRRQNWEVVIEELDPIVDRADIPELTVWLQQARMQAALSHPIEPLAEEPQAAEANDPDDDVPENVPGNGTTDEVLLATNVPETASEKLPDETNKPVPYTAQTELLDEPAEPVFSTNSAVVEDELETKVDSETKNSTDETETEAAGTDEEENNLLEDVPAAVAENEAVGELPDEAPTTEETVEEEPISEKATVIYDSVPTTGQLTDALPDGPIKTPEKPVEPHESAAVADYSTNGGVENNVPELTADNVSDTEQEVDLAELQQTEAFTDVPGAPITTPAKVNQLPLKSATELEPPVQEKVPSAASKLLTTIRLRLKKAVDDFDSEQLNRRAGEVYEEAKKAKNRPLLIGGVVVVALLLMFAVGSGQSDGGGAVQLDPNESYETSLKRFQQYARTYEKTGELDQYVWAFVHCNPVYDDSLRKSAVRRAETIRAQYDLLFGIYSEDISKLKRLEMRTMSKNQMSWEIRPHSLSDENCLPRK